MNTYTMNSSEDMNLDDEMLMIAELPSAVEAKALSAFRRLDTFAGRPLAAADPPVLVVRRRSVLRVRQRRCGEQRTLYLVQETQRRGEPRVWLVYKCTRRTDLMGVPSRTRRPSPEGTGL